MQQSETRNLYRIKVKSLAAITELEDPVSDPEVVQSACLNPPYRPTVFKYPMKMICKKYEINSVR